MTGDSYATLTKVSAKASWRFNVKKVGKLGVEAETIQCQRDLSYQPRTWTERNNYMAKRLRKCLQKARDKQSRRKMKEKGLRYNEVYKNS